jgi:Holliday junction DNA helicase RuvA
VTEAELQLFELLIEVNGIGPKLALSVLSGLSVRDVKSSIARGDVKLLSSISGIGRKTAERMVVELKDRMGAAESLEAIAGPGEEPDDVRVRDAVLALVALGYRQDQARKRVAAAVEGSDGGLSVEEIVKKALNG